MCIDLNHNWLSIWVYFSIVYPEETPVFIFMFVKEISFVKFNLIKTATFYSALGF